MSNPIELAIKKALVLYDGSGETYVGDTKVSIKIEHVDTHASDSPDFVLWLHISLRIFDQNLDLKIPIPIEAEKGGILGGALEDLKKFAERKHFPIDIPMIVVAQSGFNTIEKTENISTRFNIKQLPVRLLNSQNTLKSE